MALHALSQDELLVAIRNTILVYRLKDATWETFELPLESSDNEKEQKKQKLPADNDIEPSSDHGIQNTALSRDRLYLAVSTRQKHLYMFKIESTFPLVLQLQAKTVLSRVSSRLRFSSNAPHSLLVADKTGDCYLWDTVELKLVCGHLSMVTDIVDIKEFVLTCDRDEKIKVTTSPHNIHAYCVGHREYVSQIEPLPHNPDVLCSVSGDKTLRFWDFEQGREIFKLPLPHPGLKMCCFAGPEEGVSTIACTAVADPTCHFIQVYQVKGDSAGTGLKMRSSKQIPVNYPIKSIDHIGDDILILYMDKDGTKPTQLQFNYLAYQKDCRAYVAADTEAINKVLAAQFSAGLEEEDRDELEGLVKKHYDNLADYLDRKKRRIQAQSAKGGGS